MSLTNTIQPLQTLRFVYTEEITDLLNNFAKEHYKDDKTKFKKEWNDWIKQEEIERFDLDHQYDFIFPVKKKDGKWIMVSFSLDLNKELSERILILGGLP
jgi:hypothetical protein